MIKRGPLGSLRSDSTKECSQEPRDRDEDGASWDPTSLHGPPQQEKSHVRFLFPLHSVKAGLGRAVQIHIFLLVLSGLEVDFEISGAVAE